MSPKRVRTTQKPKETATEEAPAPVEEPEAPAPVDEPMSTFEDDLEKKLQVAEFSTVCKLLSAEVSDFPTHPTPNL